MVCACDPRDTKVEAGLWGLLASQPRLLGELETSERLCLKDKANDS